MTTTEPDAAPFAPRITLPTPAGAERAPWHYMQEEKAGGPVPWSEIVRLAARREIHGATALRQAGEGGWTTLGALVGPSSAVPPPPVDPDVAAPERQAYLVRRASARIIDATLAFLAWSAIMTAGGRVWVQAYMAAYPVLMAILVIALLAGLMMAVSAVPISLIGSSLGKWVVGLRVSGKNGKTIGLRRAFLRDMRALVFGGIYQDIFLIRYALSLRRDWETSWDRVFGTVVRSTRPGTRGWLIAGIGFVVAEGILLVLIRAVWGAL